MNELLYYPYINLPHSDWTIRTLLYYEKLSTIVPQEYFYAPERNYEPHMLELVRNELVIPIDPMRTISNPWEITRPFIEYTQEPEFNIESKRESFGLGKFGKIHVDKFKPQGARIHTDKFDGEIFYQLENMGLAKRMDHSWYIVEYQTASFLMTFLATIISSKLSLQPITDKIVVSSNKNGPKTEPRKNTRKREIILRELIPFPSELDLNKFHRFKNKYNELLVTFKNKVEQIVLDETIEEGTELFNNKLEELKLRKSELAAKMNESKVGNIIFGSICGIIGAIQGLATAETPGAIIGGLPGFASAIYSAIKLEKAEDIFDQSGMKYLALADKRLR